MHDIAAQPAVHHEHRQCAAPTPLEDFVCQEPPQRSKDEHEGALRSEKEDEGEATVVVDSRYMYLLLRASRMKVTTRDRKGLRDKHRMREKDTYTVLDVCAWSGQ
jgi:hypothetical protein